MAGIVRVGDPNVKGGLAMYPASTSVTINGRPAVLMGAMVTSHPPCPKPANHCAATTGFAPPKVLIEGKPVALTGIPDTCGCMRIIGSTDVNIG